MKASSAALPIAMLIRLCIMLSPSSLLASLLELAEVFRAERMRQQLVQREGRPHSVWPCGVDRGVAGCELS